MIALSAFLMFCTKLSRLNQFFYFIYLNSIILVAAMPNDFQCIFEVRDDPGGHANHICV